MSASGFDEQQVTVRGNATADDVAAVLAVLRDLVLRAPAVSRYDQWRARRIAALRDEPPAARRT